MRNPLTLIAVPITLAFACSGSSNTQPGSGTGGEATGHGGSTTSGISSGGASTNGGTSATTGGSGNGATGVTGGSLSTGGSSPAGQGGATGGAPTAKGGAVGNSGTGGMLGMSGSGGGSGSSGAGSGGAPTAGTGGNASGGKSSQSGGSSSGSGGGNGNTAGCTRELLKSTTDQYFKALAAHTPSTLPLSDSVKFTENGKVLKLGEEGLWKTAGALKYAHIALDTETCNAVSQSVVPDGNLDIPLGLRIKLQDQKITEIETIAVRPGDYKVSGQNFASNTDALIASGDTVKWEDPVAADQRNSRTEITGWMDKYFRLFPSGVCNTTSDCKRIENGGGSFSCSAGASCAAGQPGSGQPALNPRLILADVESGLGVGFTMFQGNTDMHMFKMYGGKVHGVSAILGAAASSGWE